MRMGIMILLLLIVLLFALWRGHSHKIVLPVVFLLGVAIASAGQGAVAKASYAVLDSAGGWAISAVEYMIGHLS